MVNREVDGIVKIWHMVSAVAVVLHNRLHFKPINTQKWDTNSARFNEGYLQKYKSI